MKYTGGRGTSRRVRSARIAACALLAAVLMAAGLYARPASAQAVGTASQLITWTCSTSPCPYGQSLSGNVAVWTAPAVSQRLGYVTSSPAYLPPNRANGMTVTITSGTASLFAGAPNASSHTGLAALTAGQSFTVTGLAGDQNLSIQGSAPFTFTLTAAQQPTPSPTPTPPGPTPTPTPPPNPGPPSSHVVTLTCTSSPCPHGQTLSGSAAVWDQPASSERLGYTASSPIYLPADRANGMTVTITSGSAVIYGGAPQSATHYQLASLGAGQSYTINGGPPGQYVSILGSSAFTFGITTSPTPTPTPTPPGPTPTPTPTPPGPTPTPTPPGPTPTPTPPPNPGPPSSHAVTLSCTSSPCPYGQTLSGSAAVWDQPASSERLGYTASSPMYLPADRANGMTVTITSGSASIFAGAPQASSHAQLASLGAGQSFTINGVAAGSNVSVQGPSPFTFDIAIGPPAPTPTPTPTPTPGCTDPQTCTVVQSIGSRWECNTPGCTAPDWIGSVINWPSWSAYGTNGRSGDQSRTVYSLATGEQLTPYMGSWANGCVVTAEAGQVLLIEWERGTDVWVETLLSAGQSHVISLQSPQDGALIEGYDGFSVSLANCVPQPLP